jgi:hypothetical protein
VPANAENIGTISVSAGQANVSNANITDSIKYAAVQHGGLGMIYTKEYDTTGTTLYTGSPTGATEFTGVSLPCWLFAGRRYTFRFRVRHDNTVSTARQFFTVHAGNSSTDVDITRRIGFQMIYIPVSGLVPNDLIQFDWEPTADGFYYLNLGLLVSSGTATVYRGTSNDRTWITVEDKGSNSYDRLIRTTGA